ncbi:MAG: cobalamin B12-binding domain-containing protein [Deltaproteobacteria bacterium]|nr:cobalamin B12-binding domain-containing protein [Deltaproteobacteria bacterium]
MTTAISVLPSLPEQPIHPLARDPLGRKPRVLLVTPYGPYAVDDEESRKENPMELYHNQVTREQGVFSLRMHHRTFGLMLIQHNLDAPCTLLDFPTLERFTDELKSVRYDVIGIGAIIPNLPKVAKMCALIRKLQPHATIVVGGHVANHPDVKTKVDADHIVRGEGVAWMRRFLGEDASKPMRHPAVLSGIGAKTMGVPLGGSPQDTAAMVLCSVGCPMGCNFCATSAMFGGKGKMIHFYETGDQLFALMCSLEQQLGTQAFFMMDENFLLHRKRALRLLELMEQHGKPWALYVFSSAHVLSKYTMDQLVRLGISWVWMGLEGEDASYDKLRGIDVPALVRELQENGMRVLGSSIIGLESHTPENIGRVIDYAVSYNTDFHQFMLYTPIPGTPLWNEHKAKGDLLSDDEAKVQDVHGQTRFNFHHAHIPAGAEGGLLKNAFRRDFEVNGPSVLRLARTTLHGWLRHKNHESPRVRERVRREAKDLALTYSGGLWAAARYFKKTNPQVAARMQATLDELVQEYGLKTRLAAPLVGRVVLAKLRAEEARLRGGVSLEPPTFYEKNAAAHAAGVIELRGAATGAPQRTEVVLPAAARVAS